MTKNFDYGYKCSSVRNGYWNYCNVVLGWLFDVLGVDKSTVRDISPLQLELTGLENGGIEYGDKLFPKLNRNGSSRFNLSQLGYTNGLFSFYDMSGKGGSVEREFLFRNTNNLNGDELDRVFADIEHIAGLTRDKHYRYMKIAELQKPESVVDINEFRIEDNVAKIIGVSQPTVNRFIEKFIQNRQMTEMNKKFTDSENGSLLLYNLTASYFSRNRTVYGGIIRAWNSKESFSYVVNEVNINEIYLVGVIAVLEKCVERQISNVVIRTNHTNTINFVNGNFKPKSERIMKLLEEINYFRNLWWFNFKIIK